MNGIYKTFYLFLALSVFVLMQLFMSNASNRQLLFLSKPTNEIVSIYTSSVAEYNESPVFIIRI